MTNNSTHGGPPVTVPESVSEPRCPFVSSDPVWTGRAREDGWRCGEGAGHPNNHVLYSADGERRMPHDYFAWKLPAEATR